MAPGPLAIGAVLVAAAHLSAASFQQNEPRIIPAEQPPVFRSGIDIVAVDVHVVSRDGLPIDTLGIDDFRVSLNGHSRKVVSVDFVRSLSTAVAAADHGAPQRQIFTPGYMPPGARVFVIAVDSSSLAPGAVRPVARAAEEFLRTLPPEDFAGLYVYPFEQPLVNLTHDRSAVSRAIDRVMGNYVPFAGRYALTHSEAFDIAANDGQALQEVAKRECAAAGGGAACQAITVEIKMEAAAQAAYYEMLGKMQVRGLSLLFASLATVEGRKTVVLLSGGMPSTDRVGGRGSLAESMTTMGAEGAAANANLYVIHLDNSFADAISAANHPSTDPTSRIRSQMRDADLLGLGLDRLAGAAGGAMLRDPLGTGARAFERVLRETSGYYLLGVQPVGQDRDGKLHYLRVNVKKRGLTVRSRTHVVIPKTR